MSMRDTAAALGVSVPTVRQMVANGQLQAFRTPGGHLRFTVESVRAAKGGIEPAEIRDRVSPSSLSTRRERIEELGLEAQELRAQCELDALRREQEQETAERRAESERIIQERKDHTQRLREDRERAKLEESEDRARHRALEIEQTERAHFISTWVTVGLRLVPSGVPPENARRPVFVRCITNCSSDSLYHWGRSL
jgi:excisionase family DNA binding protein